MLNKPREEEEYVEQLHQQHDTLEQLSAMINNMPLLAKTQKGLSDSQVTTVDTEVLINKLLDYFEMIAEDRKITFVKLGDFKAVLGDEGLLQRLFANLLSNAITPLVIASSQYQPLSTLQILPLIIIRCLKTIKVTLKPRSNLG